jgi:electron transfer flavoprotein alpha subunit
MAEVLVVVEAVGDAIKKVTLEMLTMARGLGEPSAVVLGGPGAAEPLAASQLEYFARTTAPLRAQLALLERVSIALDRPR